MSIKRKVTVIFKNDSTNSLPLYTQYPGELAPQDAFITLDLRNGEIDADYTSGTGNGVPIDVWNSVVIRFLIDPCITDDSILRVINAFKDELEAFYNESDAEINFNGNEVGIPLDGDTETWQDKIRSLKETIKSYSHDFAVDIADDDTFSDVIKLTPATNILRDYATSVLDSIKENCFVDDAMDDVEVVSRLIMEMYVQNTECLSKNGMEMLLANIDDYADQIGYDRDDIDEDDIKAAMERA